jgi:hypothetical protein
MTLTWLDFMTTSLIRIRKTIQKYGDGDGNVSKFLRFAMI